MLRNSPFIIAIDDIAKGWEKRQLWLALAWDDIRLKYKRSVLGPMWITLGTGFFISILSVIWTELMAKKASVFVPWFAVGIITWQFISSIVTEGSATFFRVSSIIHNIAMPLSIHIFRSVTGHIINYLHNCAIIIVVLLIFPAHDLYTLALIVPGMFILIAAATATSIIFGLLGARFRDFSHAVSMFMKPVFFMTPVIWMPDMLSGGRAALAKLNPFAHYLAIIREPLIGKAPTVENYIVTIALTLLLILVSLILLGKYKNKVPYWV